MAGRAEVSAAEQRALIARSAAPVRYSVFPPRYHIHRFGSDARDAEQVERASLGTLLAGLPEGVGEHACTVARWDRRPGESSCKPLQEHGLNIEGLAVRDGQLYLGLRAPVLEGRAFIVRVAIDGVFGSITPAPKVLPLGLGPSVGIRDIVRVEGGFLILTGPALPETDRQVGNARIFFWREGAAPRDLGPLAEMQPDEKPEALLVLGEDAQGYRVLVMSDGTDKSAAGRPTEYHIRK
jgi:Protein of unknown function (DUF3616)